MFGAAPVDVAARDLAEGDGAAGIELEGDDRLLGLLVEARLGVDEAFAAKRDLLLDEFAATVGAGQDHVARRGALGFGRRRGHRRMHQVKGQTRRTRDDVLEPRRVVEPRHLDQYAIRALPLDQGLGGAKLVDALADDFDRLADDRGQPLGHPGFGEGDGDLAVRARLEGQLGDATHRDEAGTDRILQRLERRERLLLLRGIGQLDGDRAGLGGDDVADAVIICEDGAGIAPQFAQALGDDAFPVHLQEEVRAALQVEAKHHLLLGSEARPSRNDVLGEEVRHHEDDAEERHDGDEDGAKRRGLHDSVLWRALTGGNRLAG
jgi:hypothetical protein